MAGGQERTLRRRIKSVQSTKKITRAMELIAASRIVRAMARIAAARPYYRELSEIVRDLARASGIPKTPYTDAVTPGAPEVIVAVTSDRGLCGGYNSSVVRLVERLTRANTARGTETLIIAVGKKAQSYFRYRSIPVERTVLTVTDRPVYDHVLEIIGDLLARFEAGEISTISVVSNRFISSGVQRLEQVQLAPIPENELKYEASESVGGLDFEFEPSSDLIVLPLMRQFALAKLFALLLEASAAEYAARQRAMKAASDNADELTKVYRRQLNRARQDSITNEIMEIVGGAEALSKAGSTLDSD